MYRFYSKPINGHRKECSVKDFVELAQNTANMVALTKEVVIEH